MLSRYLLIVNKAVESSRTMDKLLEGDDTDSLILFLCGSQ